MRSSRPIVLAFALAVSLSSTTFAGTIVGARSTRSGTIVGARTGNIVGARTGNITGARTGNISGTTIGSSFGGRSGFESLVTGSFIDMFRLLIQSPLF
jgi:hypothetical protein